MHATPSDEHQQVDVPREAAQSSLQQSSAEWVDLSVEHFTAAEPKPLFEPDLLDSLLALKLYCEVLLLPGGRSQPYVQTTSATNGFRPTPEMSNSCSAPATSIKTTPAPYRCPQSSLRDVLASVQLASTDQA